MGTKVSGFGVEADFGKHVSQDASHAHRTAKFFHIKGAFIDVSTGAPDAGKPIKLDSAGKIDSSMINGGGNHNLLSATHPDTVVGSPVRGDLIVGSATPKWEKLALGIAGKFIRSDGSDALWASIVAGDLPSHTHVKADITDTPWVWADVSKTGSNLTDLVTRLHSSLQSIGVDDHHDQAHILDGADHSISGKTPGHFLKALTATTFGFAAHGLTYSDVGAAAASHNHVRSNITDFWASSFWANIPDKPSTFPPSSHNHDERYYTEDEIDTLLAGYNEFTELTDTPSSYTGQAGKFVKVNATPDGLEFADIVAGDLPSHTHVKANITDTPWAWGDVSKVGSNLIDLATRQHAGLSDAPADAHHPQLHASAHHVGGGDLVNHDSLTGFLAAEHLSLPNSMANVINSGHTKTLHDGLGIDAATVGTLAASAFIRSNANDNVSGHTEWQDNFEIRLGNGADFRMWHDGSHHYFRSYLHGSNLYIVLENATGTARTLATFDPDEKGLIVGDHGAAATDMTVNVCYGTGSPPTATNTTIGTLFVKY